MTTTALPATLRPRDTTSATAWQMPAWRREASCLSADPDAIFPSNGRPPKSQLDSCKDCPVRPQCLEFALEGPWMPFGPWGGLPQAEVQTMWLARHPRDRSNDDSVLAYIGLLVGGHDED